MAKMFHDKPEEANLVLWMGHLECEADTLVRQLLPRLDILFRRPHFTVG